MERFTSTVEQVQARLDQRRSAIVMELDRVTAAPREGRRDGYRRLRLMVAKYTALRDFLLPGQPVAPAHGTAPDGAGGPVDSTAEAAVVFERSSMTAEDSDRPLADLAAAVRRDLSAEPDIARLDLDADRLGEIHRALDTIGEMDAPGEQLNPPDDSYAQVWAIARREVDSFLGQVGGAGPGARED